MSLFSSDVQKVETWAKQDAETVLKALDSLAAAVKNGQVHTEFLNVLAILQPFILVAEQAFPQYAPTIEWAEALLKNALQAKF
jgi:hypothetical protein